MHKSNTFNQLKHDHMRTHKPNGPSYMDETITNTLMNHNGSRTNNGPKINALMQT